MTLTTQSTTARPVTITLNFGNKSKTFKVKSDLITFIGFQWQGCEKAMRPCDGNYSYTFGDETKYNFVTKFLQQIANIHKSNNNAQNDDVIDDNDLRKAKSTKDYTVKHNSMDCSNGISAKYNGITAYIDYEG